MFVKALERWRTTFTISRCHETEALAYLGSSSPLLEIVAGDALLESLDDQVLRVRFLETEPYTLDEALNIACHLEALDKVIKDTPI